jgi:tetratricopeptide (TPR) repeat protein
MTETLITEARARQEAGRLEEAEWMYGSLLERDPGNADAWHLLGRVALQKGEFAVAAARVLQAIRLRPRIPALHTSLGEILAAQHRDREAMLCYREALRLEAGYVPALVNLGNALQNQRLDRDACVCYWRAIRHRPECAEAFSNLGNSLGSQGEYQEAVACYREACALQPENAVYAVNLAAGLIHLERHAEAEEWARRAVRLQPLLVEALSNLSVALTGQQRLVESEGFARQALDRAPEIPHLHLNLGCLLLQQERFAEAETELRRALELRPDYPQAVNNLAVALHRQDREEEAASWCERLLSLLPQHGEVWANLGIVRQAQGRNGEAILCFEEALQRQPDDYKSHVCRSLSLLAEGRFREGFEEYEWRWKMLPQLPRAAPQPPWNGGPLHGKTILLWAEQGLGDTIQFARYAPLVAARGGRVMVECQDCLVSLVQSIGGVSAVVGQSQELPPFDVQAPLMSLPRLLDTAVDSIPGAVPYVRADAARVARYRGILGPARGLRAGLAWAGSPRHTSDRLRSIPLARLAALREVPGVEWHSLQVEEKETREARGAGGWLRPPLEVAPDAGYLAAMMSCLDLVVTVDTMPAHLAGALGRPVWTLLGYVPDWRWQIARDGSPWYPGMRLFRQERPGDWEGVIEKVRAGMGALIQAFRTGTDKQQ